MKLAFLLGGVALFVIGAGTGATAHALMNKKQPPTKIAAPEKDDSEDEDALAAANTSLVKSLQECNRRLAAKGEQQVAAAPAPAASASSREGRRNNGRGRDREAPPPPDWEKLAEEGAVPYRIPCIRSTPFVPTERQLDRLGLAPQDGDMLKEAYAKSNERMMAQIVPLCARVVGSKEVAERIGAQACMSAITDGARNESADKMKSALTRVAEVNGGKRVAPAAGEQEPVEALMLAMTKEAKAFEQDLAARVGPEEAARIASSRGLCSERGTLRATNAPPGRDRVP